MNDDYKAIEAVRSIAQESWQAGYRKGFNKGIYGITWGLLMSWFVIFMLGWIHVAMLINLILLGIAVTNVVVFELSHRGILETPKQFRFLDY